MKRLLCWCICLWVVGSPLQVVGGQWSVVGTTAFRDKMPSRALRNTQVQEVPPTGHRPPTTDHLPCTDSSPTCLATLGDLVVQNNRELVVLEQAIQLQKKKLWTNWLNADGLHPLAIGLRLARNIAGGGDRAAAKLEIARLELRQAELITNLRESIVRVVLEYEAAQQQLSGAETKLAAYQTRLNLISMGYRLGEGSTETMLLLWETETELQDAMEQAKLMCSQRLRQLQTLVVPFASHRLAPSHQSQK